MTGEGLGMPRKSSPPRCIVFCRAAAALSAVGVGYRGEIGDPHAGTTVGSRGK